MLSPLYASSYFTITESHEEGIAANSVTDEKIELEEVKALPQGHTARARAGPPPPPPHCGLGPRLVGVGDPDDKAPEAGEINAAPEP